MNKKINIRYSLSEIWNIIKKYKWAAFTVIFLAAISSTGGIIEKYILKNLVDTATEFSTDTITKIAFIDALIIIALSFIVLKIIMISVDFICGTIKVKTESKYIHDLKQKYFNYILSLSHKFHTTHKSGSLISKLNRGTNSIERFADIIQHDVIPFIVQFVIISISFTIIDWRILVILIITMIAFTYSNVKLTKKQQVIKLKKNDSIDNEGAFISNIFTNIDSVKFFGKEKLVSNNFSNKIRKTKTLMFKDYHFYNWMNLFSNSIFFLSLLALMYLTINSFIEGNLTLGELIYIYTLFGMFSFTMKYFVGSFRGLYETVTGLDGLFRYKMIKNEIKDHPNAKNAIIKNGEIHFKNINFSYKGKKAFSLDNFNLKIRPNEKIAFVGHSGCGKSTLTKLLYRLFDVKDGQILIDGENIKNFKQESLRSELSIVPQECILFDDTIYNNIKFSKPTATKEEVMSAIKFAQLDRIIERFSKGVNTIVGERGIKLSGGERQRVSIARAILANKKILVLDEATSALDSQTEYDIQQDLKKLLKGRTSIIIAHRLSTIMDADRIIVMENGKIIEEGNHKTLINKDNGEYKKLWELQKGGFIQD